MSRSQPESHLIRLAYEQMPDGMTLITSPDVKGLCVAAPTLESAQRQAIEVLDFMRGTTGKHEKIVEIRYAAA